MGAAEELSLAILRTDAAGRISGYNVVMKVNKIK